MLSPATLPTEQPILYPSGFINTLSANIERSIKLNNSILSFVVNEFISLTWRLGIIKRWPVA